MCDAVCTITALVDEIKNNNNNNNKYRILPIKGPPPNKRPPLFLALY